MAESQQRPRRTPGGVVGDLLLWLAAAGGVICIAAVIAASVFHVTLIMFKTGSMEPTIPAGSLAVVHEIPASDVRVGDIVTVDRAGELPVTHRVTSASDAGGSTSLTLRGDANATDDAAPYLVDHVRIVWAWVPGWASVVVWFSNPVVLGGLTVGATALVTWAFWPRDERRGRRRAGAPAAGAAVLALCGAMTLGGPPSAAQAAETETVVSSRYLTLTSISDPQQFADMETGTPVPWQVGVDATPPEPGDVHIGLSATGAMAAPGMLQLEVEACPVRWVAAVCGPGAVSWIPSTDLADAAAPATAFGAREIGVFDSASAVWLMMRLTMTAPSAPSGSVANVRLQVWGAGTLSVGAGELAATGPAEGSLLTPALLCAGAIGSGLLIAVVAGRRRRAGA